MNSIFQVHANFNDHDKIILKKILLWHCSSALVVASENNM